MISPSIKDLISVVRKILLDLICKRKGHLKQWKASGNEFIVKCSRCSETLKVLTSFSELKESFDREGKNAATKI